MSTIIKICGLKTPEAVDAALAAGADMVGLVFFAKSPRHLGLSEAQVLAERARGRAEIVALTVDAEDSMLAALVEAVRPDWLQLHGEESVERVKSLRRTFGRPVMKAVGVAAAADLARAQTYAAAADRLLIDAKPPRD